MKNTQINVKTLNSFSGGAAEWVCTDCHLPGMAGEIALLLAKVIEQNYIYI
jgi:hypothetical protein